MTASLPLYLLRTIANWVDNGTDPDKRDGNGDWEFSPTVQGSHNDQNIITEYEYDDANRRVKVINPNGDESFMSYFKDGTMDTMTDLEGVVSVYRSDNLNRRTRIIQNYVNNGEDPSLWVWDGTTDNRWEESDGTAIGHGSDNDQNIIVDVNYDVLGRMTQLRDPRGNVTSYEYDSLGRRTKLTNPLSKEWVTAYAHVGNVAQTTMTYPGINGGSSYSVQRDFDRLGRLAEIDYSDLTNTPTVQFTYDSDGNRQKMTEIGTGSSTIRETTYSYDELGRLTSVGFDTDGDSSVDETVSYEYDISGNRTKLTLPGSDDIIYAYDDKGRLTSIADWDGQVSTFQYDKANRHIGTQRSNGFYSRYAYNPAGHLQELRHGEEWDTVKALQSFVYTTDKRGNRTQAKELTFRDTAGSSVTIAHDDPSIVYRGDWDANGSFHETTTTNARLAVMFYGNTSINLTMGTGDDCGIYDVYINKTLWQSYDGYAASAGEDVIPIEVKGDGPHLLEVFQRREKNSASSGYKVRFKQLTALSAYDTTVIDYTYDNLSRLLEADYSSDRNYQYQYDLAGNKLQDQTTIGITTTTTDWTYNAANQMATMQIGANPVVNMSYDNNGDMLDDGVLTYTWDRANRLKTLNNGSYNTHFAYDGNGDRHQQNVGGTITNYLNDVGVGLTQVLSQTTGANTDTFVHGLQGMHSMHNQAGDWSYALHDGLGSVRAEISATGQVVSSQNYSPYGQPFDTTGTPETPFAFTGQMLDDSGLQYHRARYYNPSMGGWASQDVLETGNRYGYVNGNPVNAVDPSGYIASGQCWQTCSDDPYAFPLGNNGGDSRPGQLSGDFFKCFKSCQDYSQSGTSFESGITGAFADFNQWAQDNIPWAELAVAESTLRNVACSSPMMPCLNTGNAVQYASEMQFLSSLSSEQQDEYGYRRLFAEPLSQNLQRYGNAINRTTTSIQQGNFGDTVLGAFDVMSGGGIFETREGLHTLINGGCFEERLAGGFRALGGAIQTGFALYSGYDLYSRTPIAGWLDDVLDNINPNVLYMNPFPFGRGRRNIFSHEGDELGHTLAKHSNRTDAFLKKRIRDEGIDAASSFWNETTANRVMGKFKKNKKAQVAFQEWLDGDEHLFVWEFEMPYEIGKVITPGNTAGKYYSQQTKNVRVVIRRDNSPHGWHYFTVFPTS